MGALWFFFWNAADWTSGPGVTFYGSPKLLMGVGRCLLYVVLAEQLWHFLSKAHF